MKENEDGRKGLAERVGFEPTVHFWCTHAFQACSFSHSDISPFVCVVNDE